MPSLHQKRDKLGKLLKSPTRTFDLLFRSQCHSPSAPCPTEAAASSSASQTSQKIRPLQPSIDPLVHTTQALDSAPKKSGPFVPSRSVNVNLNIPSHTSCPTHAPSSAFKVRSHFNGSFSHSKLRGGALATRKAALTVLQKGANAVPMLKPTVDAFANYVDTVPVVVQNDKVHEGLIAGITTVLQSVGEHLSKISPTEMGQDL
ncbi:hypothetical protein FRC07_011320, partial [Ceratobasidium sp. 392]